MANDFSRSPVHLDVDPTASRPASVVSPQTPFRILVVGDFSGRNDRQAAAPLRDRTRYRIDRDNFDTVLSKIGPSVRAGSITLGFQTLNDFHPDRLLERVPAFAKLEGLKKQNPPPPRAATAPGTPPSDLLDEIVQRTAGQTPIPATAGDFDSFVRKITAPHLESQADEGRRESASHIDETRSDLLRALLHHEAFQELEASWRGLAMLVDRLNTDGPLKIHVFDATLEELLADEEGLRALLARSGDPWGVVVGCFVFDQTEGDSDRLARLASAAAIARVPFVAEADPPSGNMSPAWQDFRRSSNSVWIGLAMPRFLLRLPYGPQTAPIDSFSFEEMPRQDHNGYLWGNPAFCCAYLLGLAFLSDGWQMRPGLFRQVSSLPVHTFTQDGETVAQPCAEVLLTERQAEFVLDQGYMPLASVKNTDSALLLRFQSVSQPPSPLAGPWARDPETLGNT
jgi:type VI secretion system protein ImpC